MKLEQRDQTHNGKLVAYANAMATSFKPLELYRKKNYSNKELSSDLASAFGASAPLDASFWLPLAADQYCINKDLKNYIMVPVPSIISDVPNTNGVSFPKPELLKFHPEFGMPAFKTFKGKPTFYEHANTDISKAKGVILDVFLTPLKGYGQSLAKVVKLLAFDREKDPLMCNRILSGDLNSYSMGAYFEGYTCSSCGAEKMRCHHTGPKEPLKYSMDGKTLVYRNLYNITGFECSGVESPAYISALSDVVMALDNGM